MNRLKGLIKKWNNIFDCISVTNKMTEQTALEITIFVDLGRHSNIYEEDKKSIQKVQEVDKFIQKIKKAKIEIEEVLKKTNEIMKPRIDKSRRKSIKYKEENLV